MLIGELSQRSGVSTRMLRHYDSLGLVAPSRRTAGGYREYSDADLQRLFQVESLRSLGLSLAEVRAALEDAAVTPDAVIAELTDEVQRRIAREHELLRRLQRVGEAGAGDWADVLQTVQLLRESESEYAALRQRAALSTAGRRPLLPAGSLAEALLSEPDPNVAGALRWALAELGDSGLDALVAALDSSDGEVRQRAVVAIAEIHTPSASEALERALRASDDRVRRHAALALGARGITAAAPTLLAMIEEGASDVEAGETLGRLCTTAELADELARALLARLSASGVSASARLRLVQALAELPSDVARTALADLTRDTDRVVALTATSITRSAGSRRRARAPSGG